MHKGVRSAGVIVLWLITIVEAVGIGAPGTAKFRLDVWPRLFVGWGYPVWFTYVIGVVEVAGALAILVPRLATWAALVLGTVMLGAVVTLILHPGTMGWGTPVVHIVLLAIIAVARWRGRLGSGS